MATLGTTSEGLDKAITERVDKAKAAQASGDTKECIAITSQVLERMEKPRRQWLQQRQRLLTRNRRSCRRRACKRVYCIHVSKARQLELSVGPIRIRRRYRNSRCMPSW